MHKCILLRPVWLCSRPAGSRLPVRVPGRVASACYQRHQIVSDLTALDKNVETADRDPQRSGFFVREWTPLLTRRIRDTGAPFALTTSNRFKHPRRALVCDGAVVAVGDARCASRSAWEVPCCDQKRVAQGSPWCERRRSRRGVLPSGRARRCWRATDGMTVSGVWTCVKDARSVPARERFRGTRGRFRCTIVAKPSHSRQTYPHRTQCGRRRLHGSRAASPARARF